MISIQRKRTISVQPGDTISVQRNETISVKSKSERQPAETGDWEWGATGLPGYLSVPPEREVHTDAETSTL